MSTILIGTDEFTIAGSLDGANTYNNGKITPHAAVWRAVTTSADTKARALITATDLIIAEGLVLADEDATPITTDNAPAPVVGAVYELAAMLVATPSLATKTDQGKNIQSLTAGAAAITFFAPVASEDAPRFPGIIDALLAPYRAVVTGTTSSAFRARRGGTAQCSRFYPDFDLSGGQ